MLSVKLSASFLSSLEPSLLSSLSMQEDQNEAQLIFLNQASVRGTP